MVIIFTQQAWTKFISLNLHWKWIVSNILKPSALLFQDFAFAVDTIKNLSLTKTKPGKKKREKNQQWRNLTIVVLLKTHKDTFRFASSTYNHTHD